MEKQLVFFDEDSFPDRVSEVKLKTAKAAICQYFLDGFTLNIKNCFRMVGVSNLPREVPRMIERPFGVIISRTPMEGTSRYGQSCTWMNYHLNKTEYNLEGIEKMKEYVKKNTI